MSKPDLVPLLDFQIWFDIKKSSDNKRHPLGWDCGEDLPTCDGALNLLCARNLTGNADYNRWWGFELCLMENQTIIPSNAPACAHQSGVDPTALQQCVAGPLGQTLLEVSAAKAMVSDGSGAPVIWTPWFVLQDVSPDPKQPVEIPYLKVVCDAYTKAGGSPLPKSCKGSQLPALAEEDPQGLSDDGECSRLGCFR